jgi:hypothetical protein
MTFTQAIDNNKAFNLSATFVADKLETLGRYVFSGPDGCNLRWVRSPEGMVGFVRATRAHGTIVEFPVSATKRKVKTTVRCFVDTKLEVLAQG